MNKLHILLSALIFTTNAFTQTPTFAWVAGTEGSGAAYVESIVQDDNGNICITGQFYGTVDFDPGVNISSLTATVSNDIFVQKLDENGNLLWVIQMGNAIYSGFGNSITTDINSNIFVLGRFGGTVDFDPGTGVSNLTAGSGNNDIFVQKLDPNGNLLWVKQMGGNQYSIGNELKLDVLGNIYITGYFQGIVDFDPGVGTSNLTSTANSPDIFVQKLDANGNLLWINQTGSNSVDYGFSITVDVNGDLYSTGIFEGTVDFDPGTGTSILTSAGGWDIFIQKLDANGNLLWANQVGGSTDDIGESITTDMDGNVYSTGYFQTTVDFDPGVGISILTSIGSYDMFVQKLDVNGNFLWVSQTGGTLGDRGQSIATDNNGNVYTTGYFRNTADFDPGNGVTNLISEGNSDSFIQKLDSSGNLLWVNQMGGTDIEYGYSIATGDNGEIYAAGTFQGPVDFDPGSTTAILTTSTEDTYVLKFNSCLNTSSTETISACNNFLWEADSNTYNNSGTYTATLTNISGCDSIATLVLEIDSISASVIQSSDTLESGITGAAYQWITCPQMTAVLNDTNQIFIAENNGDYALIISDGNCTDTSSCFTVSTVGYLDNSKREELRIYPNPSSTGLIQTNTDLNHSNIKVFSIDGRQINFSKNQNIIDISDNDKGVYLILINGVAVKYTYQN